MGAAPGRGCSPAPARPAGLHISLAPPEPSEPLLLLSLSAHLCAHLAGTTAWRGPPPVSNQLPPPPWGLPGQATAGEPPPLSPGPGLTFMGVREPDLGGGGVGAAVGLLRGGRGGAAGVRGGRRAQAAGEKAAHERGGRRVSHQAAAGCGHGAGGESESEQGNLTRSLVLNVPSGALDSRAVAFQYPPGPPMPSGSHAPVTVCTAATTTSLSPPHPCSQMPSPVPVGGTLRCGWASSGAEPRPSQAEVPPPPAHLPDASAHTSQGAPASVEALPQPRGPPSSWAAPHSGVLDFLPRSPQLTHEPCPR